MTGTFGQVIVTIHLLDRQVHSISNFKAWLRTHFCEIWFKIEQYLIQENKLENVIHKMAPIFSLPHCVNSSPLSNAYRHWWTGSALEPFRRQAIIWTNADILSITCQGKYFNEIVCENQIFSFKKMCLSMSSAKFWPFCPRGEELSSPQGCLSCLVCSPGLLFSITSDWGSANQQTNMVITLRLCEALWWQGLRLSCI